MDFFVGAAKLNPKVMLMQKLPKGYKPVTCFVLGYSDVEYQRIPPGNEVKIKYI